MEEINAAVEFPSPTKATTEEPCALGESGEADLIAKNLKLLKDKLREFLENEKQYVENLRLVCERYIPHVRSASSDPPPPESLRNGMDKILFSNIEEIYKYHKKDHVWATINKCRDGDHLEVFEEFIRDLIAKNLRAYGKYCLTMETAYHIVEKYDTYFDILQRKFRHSQEFKEILRLPTMRIQKYAAVTTEILEIAKKAKCPESSIQALTRAHESSKYVPDNIDYFYSVALMKGFHDVFSQGDLLIYGTLQCIKDPMINRKWEPYRVFLFQQAMIFAKEDHSSIRNVYDGKSSYKFHYKMNNVELTIYGANKPNLYGCFLIDNKSSNRQRNDPKSMLCKPFKDEEDLHKCQSRKERKKCWFEILNEMCKEERDLLDALQNPIAHQSSF